MEFIPYIGPIIGPIPAVLVALFDNPISAVWVVLLFVALQQLEGHFVAPQVFRISLRINPILIILSLLIGYQLYGIVGALVALPIAAMIRQTVLYLRRHLVLEPWTRNPVGEPPLVLESPIASERMSRLRRGRRRRRRVLPLVRCLAGAESQHSGVGGTGRAQPIALSALSTSTDTRRHAYGLAR